MADDDAFARRLAELGAVFRAELPVRFAEMRAAATAGDLEAVRAIAHQLAGRGGTFGAPEVTTAARAAEEASAADLPAALDALALVVEREA